MSAPEIPKVGLEDPQAALERALIEEYLAEYGPATESIPCLPPDPRDELIRAARAYASQRLAEIEARARYVTEIERDV